jgi:hypothetical protein
MSAGFVKLRRGIVEHLPERMTFEEYGIYTLIILKADHRTGVWRGCALALSKRAGKSERWCRYRLASLRKKGYILATPSNGRGQYVMKVVKYFEKRHPVSASMPEAAPSVRLEQNKRHPVSPYQEVSTYKNKRKEERPAQTSRVFFSSYGKRPKARELEGIMQIEANGARKDYQEFVDLRDARKLPRGMNWNKWQKLSPAEREQALKAA